MRLSKRFFKLFARGFIGCCAGLLAPDAYAQEAPSVVFTVDVGTACGPVRTILVNPESWNCPSQGDTGKVAGEADVHGSRTDNSLQATVGVKLHAYDGGASSYGASVPISIYVRSQASHTLSIEGQGDVSFEGRSIQVVSNVKFLFQLDEWRTVLISSPTSTAGSKTESSSLAIPRSSSLKRSFAEWPGVSYYRLTTITPSATITGGLKGSRGAANTTLVIRVAEPPPVAPTMSFVDPVPGSIRAYADANGEMIDIAPADTLPRVGGRVIEGVAADGVTRAIVRFRGEANTEYLVSLLDEGSIDPSIPSQTIGLVAAIEETFSNRSAVVRTDVDGWGFAKYLSPTDFVHDAKDLQRAERPVVVRLLKGGQELIRRDLIVVRPPVILIHGIWGSLRSWRFFDLPHVFDVYTADYSGLQGAAGGFSENARWVLPQIQRMVASYSRLQLSTRRSIAVVQADVVAHSMGGLVTRTLSALSEGRPRSTYTRGYVHKLVTLNSPHSGSPFATRLYGASGICKTFLSRVAGLAVGTGVRDLRPESSSIRDLRTGPESDVLRVHLIAGTASVAQMNDTEASFARGALSLACNKVLGLGETFQDIWPLPEGNDLIVGQYSMEARGIRGGPLPRSTVRDFVVHSAIPGVLFGPDVINRTAVGVSLGGEVTRAIPETSVPDLVGRILNVPVTESSWFGVLGR